MTREKVNPDRNSFEGIDPEFFVSRSSNINRIAADLCRVVLSSASHTMSKRLVQITGRDKTLFFDGIGRNWELHTDFVRSHKVELINTAPNIYLVY